METAIIGAREVMWFRVLDGLSFEHACLARGADGVRMTGTVLVAEDGAPLRVDYAVSCDVRWRTRTVTVTQAHAGNRRTRHLGHDGNGAWTLDGRAAPVLDGCTDIDLGVSPITNALAVNRLDLANGESATVRAAWLRFPGLEVGPAEQSYERLAERRYRYRSQASGFEAEISVDADGLPVDYAGLWRRVAEGPAAAAVAGASA